MCTAIKRGRTIVCTIRPERWWSRCTFTAMIEGIRQSALETGTIEPEAFDVGVRDLYLTTKADGAFCYTVFKGVAEKRGG